MFHFQLFPLLVLCWNLSGSRQPPLRHPGVGPSFPPTHLKLVFRLDPSFLMEPTPRTVRLSGFQDSCLQEIRIPPGIRQIRSSLSPPNFPSRSPRPRKRPHSSPSFHRRATDRHTTCAQSLRP